MIREQAAVLFWGVLLVELLAWAMAFSVGSSLRAELFGAPAQAAELAGWLVAPVLVTWIAASAAFGLRDSFRFSSAWAEQRAVLKSSAVVVATAALVVFFTKLDETSRLSFAIASGLGTAGVASLRYGIRIALLTARRHSRNVRTLVVVGDGMMAADVLSSVRRQAHWGVRPLGRLRVSAGAAEVPGALGALSALPEILDHQVVDEVVVADECISAQQVEWAQAICAETGVSLRVILKVPPQQSARTVVEDFDGKPMVSYTHPHENPLALAGKRIFDISAAVIILVLTAPLLLCVAALVKLTSSGPVFFSQVRVGRHGREFKMLKFRSMVHNAEELKAALLHANEMQGPVFKMELDPRVTPIGNFLRRTSLDEFPQFFNVLKGDMSIVGPRPPLPSEVAQYERWQRRRLAVKPGITCSWQVQKRGSTDFDDWMRTDLRYIENWSLSLDMRILFATIPAVLLRRGAR